jgi:hypothetical protein
MRPKLIAIAKTAAVINSLLLASVFVVFHAAGKIPWFSSSAEGNLSASPVISGPPERTMILPGSKAAVFAPTYIYLDEKRLAAMSMTAEHADEPLTYDRKLIMPGSKSFKIDVQPGTLTNATRASGVQLSASRIANPLLDPPRKDVLKTFLTTPQVVNPWFEQSTSADTKFFIAPSSDSVIFFSIPPTKLPGRIQLR